MKNKLKPFLFTSLLVALSSSLYLGVQTYIQTNTNEIPIQNSTLIDEWIPFAPIFIFIYASLIFMIFYTMLSIDGTRFKRVVASAFLTQLIAYSIFLLFPSKIIRPELNHLDGLLGFLMQLTHQWDAPLNNWPSLHVAYSTLMAFALGRKPLLMISWAISISLSTLFVKQHYTLDAITGFMLASMCWLISSRFINHKPKISSHS